MKKLGIFLSIILAYTIYSQVERSKRASVTPATAEAVVESMRAEAHQQHPEMNETEGLRNVAVDRSAQKLAKSSSSTERSRTASVMFVSYFEVNTRVRSEYCKKYSVDITPFVTAFHTFHSAEFDRAHKILNEQHVDVQPSLNLGKKAMDSVIEQDMKQMSIDSHVNLENVCDLFVKHPDEMVSDYPFPAKVHEALMQGD